MKMLISMNKLITNVTQSIKFGINRFFVQARVLAKQAVIKNDLLYNYYLSV